MLKQNILTLIENDHQHNQANVSTPVTHFIKSSSLTFASSNKSNSSSQLLPSKTASKQMYFDLTRQNFSQHDQLLSRLYLNEKLLAVEEMDSDLPDKLPDFILWMDENTHDVGRQYQEYLAQRKVGGGRQLLTTKAHAYNFLQSVAPTKLVDGSWLYGLCELWKDHRFSNLIKTYLEELGEGDQTKNHVVLYKKLLAGYDCEQWPNLADEYFTQGAIQLALGYNAKDYIPEVIGFNLGYEQLPLHLLITAYELKELGIDPYYFTLHVTVDNASTGHARKAVQALFDTMSAFGNTQEFLRRVNNGYKLNQLGLSTNKIIESFDLNKEFIAILKLKSVYGQSVHSNKCHFSGKTVNEWLTDPSKIPEFVDSLIQSGWIKRDQDPQLSRFWKLIEGDTAKMFGVFSGYEKQVIFDWIAGKEHAKFIHSKRADKQNLTYVDGVRSSFQNVADTTQFDTSNNSFDPEIPNSDLAELEKKLASATNMDEVMSLLFKLMSPSLHHHPTGLRATRLYKSLMHKMPSTINTAKI